MNACAECIRLLEHKAGWLEFRAHLAEHQAEPCPECGGSGEVPYNPMPRIGYGPQTETAVPCPRGCEVKHD